MYQKFVVARSKYEFLQKFRTTGILTESDMDKGIIAPQRKTFIWSRIPTIYDRSNQQMTIIIDYHMDLTHSKSTNIHNESMLKL